MHRIKNTFYPLRSSNSLGIWYYNPEVAVEWIFFAFVFDRIQTWITNSFSPNPNPNLKYAIRSNWLDRIWTNLTKLSLLWPYFVFFLKKVKHWHLKMVVVFLKFSYSGLILSNLGHMLPNLNEIFNSFLRIRVWTKFQV